MSAGRAHDVVTGASDDAPTAEEPLPVDLTLEIVARTGDAATVVRCAAASKPLRRRILDPGFHPRLLKLRAAAGGGFDPTLLVAASYWERRNVKGTFVDTVVVLPSHRRRRFEFETRFLRSFEPVSSRSGLVVLCRNGGPGIELRVYNTVTGHMASLPTMDVRVDLDERGFKQMFPPALLSIDGAGRSFELLVVHKSTDTYKVKFTAHTISSQEENGRWSAATEILWPLDLQLTMRETSTCPAVIGGIVHWLCVTRQNDLVIVALHAKADVQATTIVIKLPQELLTSMGNNHRSFWDAANSLILAATAEGKRLSLVVAEELVISVWTLLSDEGSSSWSRQVVIRRREIHRKITAGLDAYQPIRFDVFGEKSGTVLFWMKMIGLVQLNLGTKKARVLYRCNLDRDMVRAFVHEIDLVSLLQSMKPF